MSLEDLYPLIHTLIMTIKATLWLGVGTATIRKICDNKRWWGWEMEETIRLVVGNQKCGWVTIAIIAMSCLKTFRIAWIYTQWSFIEL